MNNFCGIHCTPFHLNISKSGEFNPPPNPFMFMLFHCFIICLLGSLGYTKLLITYQKWAMWRQQNGVSFPLFLSSNPFLWRHMADFVDTLSSVCLKFFLEKLNSAFWEVIIVFKLMKLFNFFFGKLHRRLKLHRKGKNC